MTYDVIIIGGGAAGLTAALYTARRKLRTLVVSQDIGGQAAMTADIENYPGVDRTDGLALMGRFRRQAEAAGATVQIEEAQRIVRHGDDFTVTTSVGQYDAHAVVLAFGLTHKHLGVPGEEPLIGRGVSYCATCDAPLYKGKRVAIVGGGNSALDGALLLSKIAREVFLLTKNDELRGEHVLIERVQATPAVHVTYRAQAARVHGTDRVTGLSYTTPAGEQTIEVDGIFVEIGFTANATLVQGLVELDDRRQIIIDENNGTTIPGVFAAGDVTTIGQKQIVISAGEGAKAALAAAQYLQARGLASKAPKIDWGIAAPTHHETM